MKIPVALQLYTVRNETAVDFVGTLEKVAEMGYKGVEFAGYGDLSSTELKSHLDRLGLKAVGSHVPLDLLKNNLDEVIRYNKEIGNKYIVCPYAKFDDFDQCKELADFLSEAGKKCKEQGLQMCYHNHAHEFEAINGEAGLDVLFKESEAQNVAAEIDTYWVTRAGVDAPGYVRKYAGRCPIIHLKDMEDSEDKHFAEVGLGVIDIKSIVDAGYDIGAEWFVVEQDKCKRPALESAKISIDNLKKMGVV
jgi:sugar phosphate isomerase/epimerase